MATTKPIILFVHGAWHTPLHYLPLLQPLRSAGFTVLSPTNATVGTGRNAPIAGKTAADDAAVLAAAMQPHLDAGREIVLVCHSYGGIPATDAAEGRTVEERAAKGLEGGIRGVVYIAAFAFPQRGMSIYDLIGGKPEGWWVAHEDTYGFPTEEGAERLYSGVESALANASSAGLVHQSLDSFRKPAAMAAPEIKAPKFYVACAGDKVFPPEGQQAFAGAMGATVTTLECGHSPFLIEKENAELLRVIKEAAGQ